MPRSLRASTPDRLPSVAIAADHGLAVVYFLQSDVVDTLLEHGVQVLLLTDDFLTEQIEQRFGRPGMKVAGLRSDRARAYASSVHPEWQWWLHFLRRVGSSRRINTEAMDSLHRTSGSGRAQSAPRPNALGLDGNCRSSSIAHAAPRPWWTRNAFHPFDLR